MIPRLGQSFRLQILIAVWSLCPVASARADSTPVGATDLVNGLVATRAGQLRIERDDDGRNRLLLRDQVVQLSADPDDSQLLLSFEDVARLEDADVVLVELGSGGSGCPSDWVFLSVSPGGATRFSSRFGNCSPLATMTREGEALHVTISETGGNPAQHVVYERGNLSCDTCIWELIDTPLNTVGGTLAFEKGGRARMTIDGKPTGVEGVNLFRVGAPIRLGSEDVVLVQRYVLKKGCSDEYLLVSVGKGGAVAVSTPFGNCTGYPSVEVGPDSIRVSFPAVQGHREARFRYRNHQVAPAE